MAAIGLAESARRRCGSWWQVTVYGLWVLLRALALPHASMTSAPSENPSANYSLMTKIQEWMAATGGSCRVSSFLQIEFEQEAAAPHVKCEITRAVVSFCAPTAAAPHLCRRRGLRRYGSHHRGTMTVKPAINFAAAEIVIVKSAAKMPVNKAIETDATVTGPIEFLKRIVPGES
jgi:hypothetical protein